MRFRRKGSSSRRGERVTQSNSLDSLESRRLLSTVTVNTGTTLGAVNANMLGLNLAAWDGKMSSSTTSPLLSAAGIDALRLAFGDAFRWTAANGGPLVNGSQSVVSMANLIAGLNASPHSVVTMNYGTAGPEEAAAELAYLNGVPSAALDNVSLSAANLGQTNAFTQFTITSLTRSGTTATATVSSTSTLTTGESLTISGANAANEGQYDKTAPITVTSPTTFTYTVTGNPTSPASASDSITANGAFWTTGGVTEPGQTVPSWQTAGFWATLRTQSHLNNGDGLDFLRIGRAQPFGIRYWEVGNEEYGTWEADMHGLNGDLMPMPAGTTGKIHDPTTYISFSKQFATLAAQIDSSISIGIVSPSTSASDSGDWVDKIMQQSVAQGFTPGFISDHIYPQGPGGESDTALLNAPVTPVGAGQSTNDIAQRASQYRAKLNANFGAAASNIQLLGTEYNSVYSNPGKQSVSIVNGLFMADSIGQMLNTGPTGYQGFWQWDLHNGSSTANNNSTSLYGWRNYGDYGMLGSGNNALGGSRTSSTTSEALNEAYPDYYAMALASKIIQAGGNVVQVTSDDPRLDVYAVKEANGHLELLVVNKFLGTLKLDGTGPTDPDAPYPSITGTFNFSGFNPAASAQISQYGSVQDTAQKAPTHRSACKVLCKL